MFEHYILGLPTQPLPFSPGALSNVSPGTCLPPTGSYFPLFREGFHSSTVRRPSVPRLSSLDGLENALEAMDRASTIEQDEVDTGLCLTSERKKEMYLHSDEVVEKKGTRTDTMAQRRLLRGKETRRLAMLTDHVGSSSAEQFVEEAEKQQETCTLAFRQRVKKVAETNGTKFERAAELQEATNTAMSSKALAAEDRRREFVHERRHSVYPSPPHESQEEDQPRSRSSSVNGPRAHWLKAYSSPIAKAHILERRSLSNGGVLHARVHKRICQRRGM